LFIQAFYIPDKETNQQITMYSKSGLKLGLNVLDRYTKIKGFACKQCGRGISYTKKYYINILDIDTLNHIIVGTFEFGAKDVSNHDLALITDGEFDLKMDAWVKKK